MPASGKGRLTSKERNHRRELDALDMTIITRLLADSDITSSDIAKALNKPLSTIQRRRTRLERSILRKDYVLNTDVTDWRSGEFFATVSNGKTEQIARQIFAKYANLTMVTTTVNSVGNLMAHIYFRNSAEMFAILEELKRLPDVGDATYAEHIHKIGERKPVFILDDMTR